MSDLWNQQFQFIGLLRASHSYFRICRNNRSHKYTIQDIHIISLHRSQQSTAREIRYELHTLLKIHICNSLRIQYCHARLWHIKNIS